VVTIIITMFMIIIMITMNNCTLCQQPGPGRAVRLFMWKVPASHSAGTTRTTPPPNSKISVCCARLAERESWFVSGVDNFQDPSRFNTVQLASISQDKSDGLTTTANTLAEVLECRPEVVEPAVRIKVRLLDPSP
jgi:hypothetical protein